MVEISKLEADTEKKQQLWLKEKLDLTGQNKDLLKQVVEFKASKQVLHNEKIELTVQNQALRNQATGFQGMEQIQENEITELRLANRELTSQVNLLKVQNSSNNALQNVKKLNNWRLHAEMQCRDPGDQYLREGDCEFWQVRMEYLQK